MNHRLVEMLRRIDKILIIVRVHVHSIITIIIFSILIVQCVIETCIWIDSTVIHVCIIRREDLARIQVIKGIVHIFSAKWSIQHILLAIGTKIGWVIWWIILKVVETIWTLLEAIISAISAADVVVIVAVGKRAAVVASEVLNLVIIFFLSAEYLFFLDDWHSIVVIAAIPSDESRRRHALRELW